MVKYLWVIVMGKFSNMLYMIDLLNTGNIYSIKDLSEKLGVTERMVRYYKDEISKNGIYIESFKGPKGGYFLIDKLKNYTSINKYDIQLLKYAYDNLKQNNFKFLDKYEQFIDKVQNMNNILEERSKFISNINISDKDQVEKIIMDAIKKSDKINITYENIDGSKSNRVIYPLQMFKYKNDKYVTAFCELRKDIRHFEVKRIVEIK